MFHVVISFSVHTLENHYYYQKQKVGDTGFFHSQKLRNPKILCCYVLWWRGLYIRIEVQRDKFKQAHPKDLVNC